MAMGMEGTETVDPKLQFLSGLGYGALLFSSFAVTVVFVVFCVCIKRNKEAVISDSNHNRSSNGGKSNSDLETAEEDSRNARATSHRKLPDLPNSPLDKDISGSLNDIADEQIEEEEEIHPRTDSVRSSQDTNSELYAQVDMPPSKGNRGEYSNDDANVIPLLSLQVPSMDPAGEQDVRPSTSREHPYAKIKRKPENLYARVGRTDTQDTQDADETDTDNYDVVYNAKTQESKASEGNVLSQSTNLLPIAASVGSTSNASLATNVSGEAPLPPPRGRRVQSMLLVELMDNDVPIIIHPPHTPTIPTAHLEPSEAQAHFSGDSQDSKGYSSISVREPLASLQKSMSIGRPHSTRARADPHYSTVSDAEDSDDMYAAIADPTLLYNPNGSDTYAQIEPRNQRVQVAVENHVQPAPVSIRSLTQSYDITTDAATAVAPVPPSLASLRQLSSSRLTASTLSIASLTSILSSPKPEKRQANSPLPLPPTPTDDCSALEEMYAKVLKKKDSTMSINASQNLFQHRGSVDLSTSELINYDLGRRNSADGTWPITPMLTPQVPLESPIEDVNYEVIHETRREAQAIALERPEMHRTNGEDAQFASPGKKVPKRPSESDPGYERIQARNDSFNDPNYERIKPRVNLGPKSSRGSADGDPNYERLRYRTVSESSEGYEELLSAKRNDPNYESVRFAKTLTLPCGNVHIEAIPVEAGPSREEDAPVRSTRSAVSSLRALPLYAEVRKPKWKARKFEQEEQAQCEQYTEDKSKDAKKAQGKKSNGSSVHLDDSVQSSNPTSTIITISQDGSAQVNYNYPTDDSLGTPEQV